MNCDSSESDEYREPNLRIAPFITTRQCLFRDVYNFNLLLYHVPAQPLEHL